MKRSCLIGFDGFTDDLVQAVRVRNGPHSFEAIETIKEFGSRILAASGVSCNIELVSTQRKLGGNAPILANALLACDHLVTFIGAIGKDGIIEPLFQEMAGRCHQVYSIAASGHTDALEFLDGKILLGKHESIVDINYQTILQYISKTKLVGLLDEADVFISANWTMLPWMNEIWRKLQQDILPFLSKKKRFLFIDLADPQKRSDSDLKEAFNLLSHWGPTHNVILGLNAAEAERTATLCHVIPQADSLRSALGLYGVIIHTKEGATLATAESVITKTSPFCAKPKVSTGAGDNFNAGFCSGLLLQLSLEQCLERAIATAGFYIRNGSSPKNSDFDKLAAY